MNPALTERRYSLFDKDLPCAAACVPIARKVDLCHSRIRVEERADALNCIESNFRDVLHPQPFEYRPTLKCNRKRSNFCHTKFGVTRAGELTVDPSFFFACDCSGPPNRGTNISAKDFFQVRNDAMTDA